VCRYGKGKGAGIGRDDETVGLGSFPDETKRGDAEFG
jgi:hypothetical protein